MDRNGFRSLLERPSDIALSGRRIRAGVVREELEVLDAPLFPATHLQDARHELGPVASVRMSFKKRDKLESQWTTVARRVIG